MPTIWRAVLLVALIASVVGCTDPKQVQEAADRERDRQEKQRLDDEKKKARAKVIRARLAVLGAQMNALEEAWYSSVTARHSQESQSERNHNLYVLLAKWFGSNRLTAAETVKEMYGFGNRIYRDSLVDEDYWDIAKARVRIQDIRFGEYKDLMKELETLEKYDPKYEWHYRYDSLTHPSK
jgi:hypothetical protein